MDRARWDDERAAIRQRWDERQFVRAINTNIFAFEVGTSHLRMTVCRALASGKQKSKSNFMVCIPSGFLYNASHTVKLPQQGQVRQRRGESGGSTTIVHAKRCAEYANTSSAKRNWPLLQRRRFLDA